MVNAKCIAKPPNPLEIAAFTINRILKLFDPTYYDSTENAIYLQYLAKPKTGFYVG
ncbi:hypothetical protein AltI4_20860 [Alteromonas sp. I4]|nr:hypothetical protein AltI4_20860 [Alteromonas sp. I4]